MSTEKAYYLFNTGILCGSCGNQCEPQTQENLQQSNKPLLGVYTPAFYCIREDCPQFAKVFKIKPVEVETI
jgi:hypothetical protein